jgi:hypothetical protein
VKSKLRLLGLIAIAALLICGGGAAGWYLRERHIVVPSVTSDFTLDAKNRPTSLTTFVTLPDGTQVQHGRQFTWRWQDQPAGCIVTGLTVEREDYVAGESRGFATWSDPSPVFTPEKPISKDVLTKYPDER